MKVSVIIPFHNAEQTIRSAVLSALSQAETNEVLLVNDASVDGSVRIAEELSDQFSSVLLLSTSGTESSGPAAARNLGIKHACNPWIAFLDADDQYCSDRFSQVAELINNNPKVQVFYGSTINEFKSAALREAYANIFAPEIDQIYLTPDPAWATFDRLACAKYGSIHLNSLTSSAEVLRTIKGFDTSLKQMEDTDLMLRLALYTDFHALPSTPPMALRRVHGLNTVFDRKQASDNRLKFLRKWIYLSIRAKANYLITLHFVRSYLGEHPFSAPGPFYKGPTLFRKLILLCSLIFRKPI